MRNVWLAAFLVATALILVACPPVRGASMVTTAVYDGISGSEMAELLGDWGYRADLEVDDEGDPRIASATGGLNFAIHFYDCQDPPGTNPALADSAVERVCESLSLVAIFESPQGHGVQSMNLWNTDKRFGKAYQTASGDVMVEMDIAVKGGVTEANLRDWMAWWEAVLGEFASHIDW